jgi:D-glycerate 3-kinase
MELTTGYQDRELTKKLYSHHMGLILRRIKPSYKGKVEGREVDREQRDILRNYLLRSRTKRKVYGINDGNVDEFLDKSLKVFGDSIKDFEEWRKNEGKGGLEEDISWKLWDFIIPNSLRLIKEKEKLPKNEVYFSAINGGQGSGKTTVAKGTKIVLTKQGYYTVLIEGDNFYMTLEQRKELMKQDSRFKHRGLCTHDIGLRVEIEEKLNNREVGFTIPFFGKWLYNGVGNRLPEDQWERVDQIAEFVITESNWEGIQPLKPEEVLQPTKSKYVNKLLDKSDPDRSFLKTINDRVGEYGKLNAFNNELMYLKMRLMNTLKARLEQEEMLRKKTGTGKTREQVIEFWKYFAPYIQIYVIERMENLADIVVDVAGNHEFRKVTAKN